MLSTERALLSSARSKQRTPFSVLKNAFREESPLRLSSINWTDSDLLQPGFPTCRQIMSQSHEATPAARCPFEVHRHCQLIGPAGNAAREQKIATSLTRKSGILLQMQTIITNTFSLRASFGAIPSNML